VWASLVSAQAGDGGEEVPALSVAALEPEIEIDASAAVGLVCAGIIVLSVERRHDESVGR
jgi:hypothetical protein